MNKAIGFVMVGTNDLEKSSKFYDPILAHLKMKRVTVQKDILDTVLVKMMEQSFILQSLTIKKMLMQEMVQWLL
jgi:hypothetical protein